MDTFTSEWIDRKSERRRVEWEALLARSKLRPDARAQSHIEATLGLYDASGRLAAAGSVSAKTLRCIAVDPDYRGEDLLGTLLSELSAYEYMRGYTHLYLYTKCESAPRFRAFGFFEIARAEGLSVFMENSATAFDEYVAKLERGAGCQAAIVINANPFTLGHRHLVETARKSCDTLHIFVVSEDVSAFSAKDRLDMVRAGTADIDGVIYHPTEDYLVSRATFPSYFLKEEDDATAAQALIDAKVFVRIARACGITQRFLGEESESGVTAAYNGVLMSELPKQGVSCTEIARLQADGVPISASRVRALIAAGHVGELHKLAPKSTCEAISSGRVSMRKAAQTKGEPLQP